MSRSDFEVVIVGGGAAGISAARRLCEEGIDTLLLEARSRLGGRAWTVVEAGGMPIDLGCGWLHSADRNPWRKIAKSQGCIIDKTPPPWARPSLTFGFSLPDQKAFGKALAKFHERLASAALGQPDVPAGRFLAPDERWNGLINAISTYVSGAELDRVSAHDLERYDDDDVNWRIREGLGRVIAAHAGDTPVELDCPVRRIDLRPKRLKIETAKGPLTAAAVIITLPTNVLVQQPDFFTPALPEKTAAAAGVPLGLADKLFLSLAGDGEFEAETRLFGRTDRAATGAYHFRPFGRPLIEAYFGGKLARDLEARGDSAFFDFAVGELVGLLGTDFARRVSLLRVHSWGLDPFSLGSYSHALPGGAECRSVLAAPVDNRVFFAGEACSRHDFSTAHGAYFTGLAAAEQLLMNRTQQ
jgi:monoamine oxidase